MTATIQSGSAMLKVLESWGVDRMYGFPGDCFNSMLDILGQQYKIQYIQTRSEESGVMSAAAEAKLRGRPGVCVAASGSSPRLLSGLYEARAAHAAVLALVVCPPAEAVNYGGFEEMNENALFSDVSAYTRTVCGPDDLPQTVDEAMRQARKASGPAVVMLADDLLKQQIAERDVSSAANFRHGPPVLDEPDLEAAARLIDASRRPLLFAGLGARDAGLELVSLSDYFSLPIVISGPAKGIVADDEENFLGAAARLGTKPANEALAGTDLVILVGSDFPHACRFFAPTAKCVQIDLDPAKLGRQCKVDVAILGDAGEAMRNLIKIGRRKRRTRFLEACRENMKNWRAWLKNFEQNDAAPLRVEPIFREINRVATGDAIFTVDPGNTLIHAARLLRLNGQGQRFLAPGTLASTGYAVPAGIAAKLACPDEDVFALSGDGAFAMSMPSVVTEVKYGLKIINIVFSNNRTGFAESEREANTYGCELPEIDFAKAAEAMGATGFTATAPQDLRPIFDEAKKAEGPVVIDIKIAGTPPFPAHAMILDAEQYGQDAVNIFRAKHGLGAMPTLAEIFFNMPEG